MFQSDHFHRVLARLDDRNAASRRVVEKPGFRQEAHFIADDFFKEEWTSTHIYAILRDEWMRKTTAQKRINGAENVSREVT